MCLSGWGGLTSKTGSAHICMWSGQVVMQQKRRVGNGWEEWREISWAALCQQPYYWSQAELIQAALVEVSAEFESWFKRQWVIGTVHLISRVLFHLIMHWIVVLNFVVFFFFVRCQSKYFLYGTQMLSPLFVCIYIMFAFLHIISLSLPFLPSVLLFVSLKYSAHPSAVPHGRQP